MTADEAAVTPVGFAELYSAILFTGAEAGAAAAAAATVAEGLKIVSLSSMLVENNDDGE